MRRAVFVKRISDSDVCKTVDETLPRNKSHAISSSSCTDLHRLLITASQLHLACPFNPKNSNCLINIYSRLWKLLLYTHVLLYRVSILSENSRLFFFSAGRLGTRLVFNKPSERERYTTSHHSSQTQIARLLSAYDLVSGWETTKRSKKGYVQETYVRVYVRWYKNVEIFNYKRSSRIGAFLEMRKFLKWQFFVNFYILQKTEIFN